MSIRIPLATSLKTRTGAPDKDARLTNAYVEEKGDQSVVRKRPAIDNAVTILDGTAQGVFPVDINGSTMIMSIIGDVVNVGTSTSSSSGGGSSGGGGGTGGGSGGIGWGGEWVPFVPMVNFEIPTCIEADILSLYPTDNRGTTVHLGPSETPYDVPQTTHTYSIIGVTPCGQLLRKEVTKTYSSRSEANQWKNVWTFPAVGVSAPNITGVGYGATTAIAEEQAGIAAAVHASQISPTVSYLGTTYSSPTYPLGQTWVSGHKYVGMTSPSWLGVWNATATGTQTQLTLYYIDVAEVWTYALI